jgi:hypothetical protein
MNPVAATLDQAKAIYLFDPSVVKSSSFHNFFVQQNKPKPLLHLKKKNLNFCSHFDDIYRASNNVIVISFAEQVSCLLDEGSGSTESVKKPGCLGLGNELSLLNI